MWQDDFAHNAFIFTVEKKKKEEVFIQEFIIYYYIMIFNSCVSLTSNLNTVPFIVPKEEMGWHTAYGQEKATNQCTKLH